MFTIEKGVPIPKKMGMAATLRQMEIGDSFLVPKNLRNGLHAAFKNAAPNNKYTTRKEGDMIRIWRIE